MQAGWYEEVRAKRLEPCDQGVADQPGLAHCHQRDSGTRSATS
jgi:hypothetical protein